MTCTHCELSTSHSFTVRSQLALTRRLPSGAKANPRTRLVCPDRRARQVAVCVFCSSHRTPFRGETRHWPVRLIDTPFSPPKRDFGGEKRRDPNLPDSVL